MKRSCSKPSKALNAVPVYPTAYSWISQPISCSQKLVLSRTPPFSTHPCFLSSLLIFIGHLLKMPCLSETKGQQPEGSPAPSPTYCSSVLKVSLLFSATKKKEEVAFFECLCGSGALLLQVGSAGKCVITRLEEGALVCSLGRWSCHNIAKFKLGVCHHWMHSAFFSVSSSMGDRAPVWGKGR